MTNYRFVLAVISVPTVTAIFALLWLWDKKKKKKRLDRRDSNDESLPQLCEVPVNPAEDTGGGKKHGNNEDHGVTCENTFEDFSKLNRIWEKSLLADDRRRRKYDGGEGDVEVDVDDDNVGSLLSNEAAEGVRRRVFNPLMCAAYSASGTTKPEELRRPLSGGRRKRDVSPGQHVDTCISAAAAIGAVDGADNVGGGDSGAAMNEDLVTLHYQALTHAGNKPQADLKSPPPPTLLSLRSPLLLPRDAGGGGGGGVIGDNVVITGQKGPPPPTTTASKVLEYEPGRWEESLAATSNLNYLSSAAAPTTTATLSDGGGGGDGGVVEVHTTAHDDDDEGCHGDDLLKPAVQVNDVSSNTTLDEVTTDDSLAKQIDGEEVTTPSKSSEQVILGDEVTTPSKSERVILSDEVTTPSKSSEQVILSDEVMTPSKSEQVILGEEVTTTSKSSEQVILSDEVTTPNKSKRVILSDEVMTLSRSERVILSDFATTPSKSLERVILSDEVIVEVATPSKSEQVGLSDEVTMEVMTPSKSSNQVVLSDEVTVEVMTPCKSSNQVILSGGEDSDEVTTPVNSSAQQVVVSSDEVADDNKDCLHIEGTRAKVNVAACDQVSSMDAISAAFSQSPLSADDLLKEDLEYLRGSSAGMGASSVAMAATTVNTSTPRRDPGQEGPNNLLLMMTAKELFLSNDTTTSITPPETESEKEALTESLESDPVDSVTDCDRDHDDGHSAEERGSQDASPTVAVDDSGDQGSSRVQDVLPSAMTNVAEGNCRRRRDDDDVAADNSNSSSNRSSRDVSTTSEGCTPSDNNNSVEGSAPSKPQPLSQTQQKSQSQTPSPSAPPSSSRRRRRRKKDTSSAVVNSSKDFSNSAVVPPPLLSSSSSPSPSPEISATTTSTTTSSTTSSASTSFETAPEQSGESGSGVDGSSAVVAARTASGPGSGLRPGPEIGTGSKSKSSKSKSKLKSKLKVNGSAGSESHLKDDARLNLKEADPAAVVAGTVVSGSSVEDPLKMMDSAIVSSKLGDSHEEGPLETVASAIVASKPVGSSSHVEDDKCLKKVVGSCSLENNKRLFPSSSESSPSSSGATTETQCAAVGSVSTTSTKSAEDAEGGGGSVDGSLRKPEREGNIVVSDDGDGGSVEAAVVCDGDENTTTPSTKSFSSPDNKGADDTTAGHHELLAESSNITNTCDKSPHPDAGQSGTTSVEKAVTKGEGEVLVAQEGRVVEEVCGKENCVDNSIDCDDVGDGNDNNNINSDEAGTTTEHCIAKDGVDGDGSEGQIKKTSIGSKLEYNAASFTPESSFLSDSSASCDFTNVQSDDSLKNQSSKTIYEFYFPSDLCGRLIGRQGKTISQIKERSGAYLTLQPSPYTPNHQICSIDGSEEEIQEALKCITEKFPPSIYSNVDLSPIRGDTAQLATNPVVMPDLIQLNLPQEGVSINVLVASIIDAGHLFLQLPTHPTYGALNRLNKYMNRCYSQPGMVPHLPRPLAVGVICAAPAMDSWYRAVIVAVFEETDECEIKFVDYGGYSQVSWNDLRQIRSDFMTLPFQAIEAYLANITPLPDEPYFSDNAVETLQHLTESGILQAQVVSRAEDGTPYVHIYQINGNKVTFVNRELVNRNVVQWIEIL